MSETITEQQAEHKADAYVREALDLLPPKARTEPMYSPRVPCDDPTDGGPKGRVEAGSDYWIRDLEYDEKQDYVSSVRAYWQKRGFAILSDDKQDGDFFVSAEQRDDSFRMSITGGRTGDMSIGASSPCVWPNGTPPPSTSY